MIPNKYRKAEFGVRNLTKIFFAPFKVKQLGTQKAIFGTPQRLPFRIRLPEGMKIQKSLCLHVWSLRMRSNDGMVMKFFLRKGMIPNKYRKAEFGVRNLTIFFRAIQSQTVFNCENETPPLIAQFGTRFFIWEWYSLFPKILSTV